jgi:uncharacterized protein (TIGR00730 family)
MSPSQSRNLRSICVFCGSNQGARKEYAAQAEAMGRLLGERGIRLVYGAGNVGLMGVLADAALAAGGEVIGVIPQMLVDKELAHRRLTELRIVTSMHERKALMAELSEAFIALPGGLGTYEELFEVLTWAQLGIHNKPCGCLNVLGYFDELRAVLDRAVQAGFLNEANRQLLMIAASGEELMDQLEHHRPAPKEKWLGREII